MRIHVLHFFGKMEVNVISESDIDEYILKRISEKAKNGTINRELSLTKRAFTPAIQKRIVSDKPYIRLLKEADPRRDFSSGNNSRRSRSTYRTQ